MAPSASKPEETAVAAAQTTTESIATTTQKLKAARIEEKAKKTFIPGITNYLNAAPDEPYEWDEFTPVFPDIKWDPIQPGIPYEDKGLLGDPTYSRLLEGATDVFDYTQKIGTEVRGVQLKDLTDDQKNDLARLLAYRGVVFFRDQEGFDINTQLELGRYWGKLHKHATTMLPKNGLEEVHVVHTTKNSKNQTALFTSSYLWHSDVTYEIQPPSYTSLAVLAGPPGGGGGDTIWSSNYALYDLLSPSMQKYLEGLTALHSAEEQAQGSRNDGRPVRREPVITEHPLVRTNPVTGWKGVFFNPGFVKGFVGVPKLEYEYIYRYLTELITSSPEIQARFTWEKGSVALWDNRVTNHTPSYGFAPHRRHGVRVAATAEKPYFDPNSISQDEELDALLGRQPTNKDGSLISNYND
ncbi:hypothetical protein TWF481_011557 [Arthrobotrys musiformis]|uniref:TauD/TfdA-like domain-containing protein n=1 Tax=Arthrobotrys musiformis TaxID=47236 RepID=A0AAV9VYP2_9PEZI